MGSVSQPIDFACFIAGAPPSKGFKWFGAAAAETPEPNLEDLSDAHYTGADAFPEPQGDAARTPPGTPSRTASRETHELPATDAAAVTTSINLTNSDEPASAWELKIDNRSYGAENWSWNRSAHRSIAARITFPSSHRADADGTSMTQEDAASEVEHVGALGQALQDDADLGHEATGTAKVTAIIENATMDYQNDSAAEDDSVWWRSDSADDAVSVGAAQHAKNPAATPESDDAQRRTLDPHRDQQEL